VNPLSSKSPGRTYIKYSVAAGREDISIGPAVTLDFGAIAGPAPAPPLRNGLTGASGSAGIGSVAATAGSSGISVLFGAAGFSVAATAFSFILATSVQTGLWRSILRTASLLDAQVSTTITTIKYKLMLTRGRVVYSNLALNKVVTKSLMSRRTTCQLGQKNRIPVIKRCYHILQTKLIINLHLTTVPQERISIVALAIVSHQKRRKIVRVATL
jgi:hypothetical protein